MYCLAHIENMHHTTSSAKIVLIRELISSPSAMLDSKVRLTGHLVLYDARLQCGVLQAGDSKVLFDTRLSKFSLYNMEDVYMIIGIIRPIDNHVCVICTYFSIFYDILLTYFVVRLLLYSERAGSCANIRPVHHL